MSDLALDFVEFFEPCIEFVLHDLPLLAGFFQKFATHCCGVFLGGKLSFCLIEFGAQFLCLCGMAFAGLGCLPAMFVEFGELAFVVTFDQSDAACDIRWQVGDAEVVLAGFWRFGRARVRKLEMRIRQWCVRICGVGLRLFDGMIHRGLAEPCGLVAAHAGEDRWAGEVAFVRSFNGRSFLFAKFFGQNIGVGGWRVFGISAHGVHEARKFLPWETHFDIVAVENLGSENLGDAFVDFCEGDGGLAFGDALGEFLDFKAKLGLKIMRTRLEEMCGNAMEEVAKLEAQFVWIWRCLFRRPRQFYFRRVGGRRGLHLGRCGSGIRLGGFAPETVEKFHAFFGLRPPVFRLRVAVE